MILAVRIPSATLHLSRNSRQKLEQQARQLLRPLFRNKMTAVGNRAALGLQCDAAQRLHNEIAAAAASASSQTERRHRKLETGREEFAIVGNILRQRAIEVEAGAHRAR